MKEIRLIFSYIDIKDFYLNMRKLLALLVLFFSGCSMFQKSDFYEYDGNFFQPID